MEQLKVVKQEKLPIPADILVHGHVIPNFRDHRKTAGKQGRLPTPADILNLPCFPTFFYYT